MSSRGNFSARFVSFCVLGLLYSLQSVSSEITAIITCENAMIIYADGVRVGENNSKCDTSKIFKFPDTTKVIAVYGINILGAARIIGSFSTGLVTDESWRCSKKYVPDWKSPDFDDSSWPNAVKFKKDTAIKGPKIAEEASWIWASTKDDSRHVYCRRALVAQPGVIMEIWRNIPGGKLTNLKKNPRFPDEPDSSSIIPHMKTRFKMGDNYGLRLTAYYKAPETGGYIFSIAGDNQCEFWLSMDETARNATYIIGLPVGIWTGRDDFNKYPSLQVSRPIQLKQGKVYFMQAFLKEGVRADHLSVKVKLPSGQEISPLGGENVYTGIPRTRDTTMTTIFQNRHTAPKPTMKVKARNSAVAIISASFGACLIILVVFFGILKYQRGQPSPEMSTVNSKSVDNVELRQNEIVSVPSNNSQEPADNTRHRELSGLTNAVALVQPRSVIHKKQNDPSDTKPTDKTGSSGDDDGEYEYEEVLESDGYEKLDTNRQDEEKIYHTYQKLLKGHSDYVIPADDQTSKYE